MEILAPIIETRSSGNENCSILLGAVRGDIHDIGKNNLSLLLTSFYDSMRKTIALIRAAADRTIATQPIILGGNQLNEQVCRYVGADGWVTDAMSGVRLCQKILSENSR